MSRKPATIPAPSARESGAGSIFSLTRFDCGDVDAGSVETIGSTRRSGLGCSIPEFWREKSQERLFWTGADLGKKGHLRLWQTYPGLLSRPIRAR